MNARPKLPVEPRKVLGKKVKTLRRDGILPANIYGRDFKSTTVQLPAKEFKKVYDVVHETGLVDVTLDGQAIPVLIKNVVLNPLTEEFLHADFHKVNLKEKIAAKIPVEPVGEPKAVADKAGLLEQPLMELEVEALPTELPEKIEVNVESLAAVDDQVLVSDLEVPAGVEILSDESLVVFKIGELVTKEMEEQMAADEAAAEEAAAETAEGETPAAEGEEAPAAEGEKPAEGGAEAPAAE
ncbi:MAG: 50S ribosomal protein L25 [Candidatus Levyibacteriota bacterium]